MWSEDQTSMQSKTMHGRFQSRSAVLWSADVHTDRCAGPVCSVSIPLSGAVVCRRMIMFVLSFIDLGFNPAQRCCGLQTKQSEAHEAEIQNRFNPGSRGNDRSREVTLDKKQKLDQPCVQMYNKRARPVLRAESHRKVGFFTETHRDEVVAQAFSF